MVWKGGKKPHLSRCQHVSRVKNFFVAPDNSCYQLLKVVVFSDFTTLFEKLVQHVLLFIEKHMKKGK